MIFLALSLSFFRVDIVQDLIRLVYFHLISFLVAFYYRNQFLDNLYKRFTHISSLVPMQIAKYYTISEGRENLEDIFKSEERFTVCLCSDWRNYQKITNTSEHRDVQDMLERFYEIIYSELSKSDLDGQYYADWTADELFIIFYGNQDQKDKVISESLAFCHTLATKLYIEVSNSLNKGIKYDIGLSSGEGLIGLQGPGKFKKTTITGDVAGNAKRFETQAKTLRAENQSNSFPIVVMNKSLKELALKGDVFNTQTFTDMRGDVKDIEGMDVSFWQFKS